jgi:hypothetical protein
LNAIGNCRQTSAKICSFEAIGIIHSVIHATPADRSLSREAKGLNAIGNCRQTSAKIFSFGAIGVIFAAFH